ncbi:hypothetical protein Tco_0928180 [Tanacetum coccineum]
MERSDSWSLRVEANRSGKDGERLEIGTLTYKLSQFVLDLVYNEYDAEVEFSHDSKKLSVILHGHKDHTVSVQDIYMHPSPAQMVKERTIGALLGHSIKKAKNQQIPGASSSSVSPALLIMGARLQRMWTPLGHCRGGGEGSGAEVEGHEGETRGGLEGGGWKDVGVAPSWEDHWGHCEFFFI